MSRPNKGLPYDETAAEGIFHNSHHRWYSLLAGILGELRGEPIQFPPGLPSAWRTTRAIYSAGREAVRKACGHTRRFILQMSLDIPADTPAATKGELHWMCVTEGKFLIQSPVRIMELEPRSAFTAD